ncbi:MAG: uncharacterized protein KVP18_004986 [Porospora cf. gigantea A]|uniref:uncharacterized protein n=1 Tax=Porospora cf. gigantea A TaxID=2853593 RepID=UPI00355A618A|nr:MAG: hypothetical protein KVP18_004986 [Porospora cf. gigantea A]
MRCLWFLLSTVWGLTNSSTWAILVGTSRFWVNYRHYSNALSFYRVLKRLGVPDRQIVLMLGDEAACDPRNMKPGRIWNADRRQDSLDLYGEDVEVDFRSGEVTVDNFLRVLSGKQFEFTPTNQRLSTDKHSNLLIYLTGHGGNDFLKFRDFEEVQSKDIIDAIRTLKEQNKFNEILLIVDTCQAETLVEDIDIPGVITMSSSQLNESSWASNYSSHLGVSTVDNWSYHLYRFLQLKVADPCSPATLQDAFTFAKRAAAKNGLVATPTIRTTDGVRDPKDIRVTEFFSNPLTASCNSPPTIAVPPADDPLDWLEMSLPHETLHNDIDWTPADDVAPKSVPFTAPVPYLALFLATLSACYCMLSSILRRIA